MASPFVLTNVDLQHVNVAGQDFKVYVAFLNPIAITTNWSDLNLDAQGNWTLPPNLDTALSRVQPYAATANLGPNRIGFVNEPLYFDASLSCIRHDLPVVPSSYAWYAPGYNSSIMFNGGSQCAVTWYAPGLYTIRLSVSDPNGNITMAQRQVMIYQDRQSALPGVISIAGLSGSLQNGGWQCQLTTVNSQVTLFPPDALPVGTYQPLVVMAETSFEVAPGVWSNHTLGPHGHFSPGYPYQDPRILFDGYVQSGSLHQDVDKDTLSFSCSGPQMILQEAKTHQLGYYNTTIQTSSKGVTTRLNTSPNGTGYLVAGLMTADVLHSLLQYHSNVGYYHDIHIWNANIPVAPYSSQKNSMAYYNLVYTSLSVNEGTMWSNMQDLCSNEWSQVYCERDGSIRVGPQINYRGNEYWAQPTLLGPQVAPLLINYVQDLGYTVSSSLAGIPASMPTLPAQPIPVVFVHPWGNQRTPPQIAHPYQPLPDPQVTAKQGTLNGPPLLCVFSDVPYYDDANVPPGTLRLYPWITGNWPQDLAVYPISFDVTENYTGRTSLVKLIGTMANANNLYTSWYPQNAFKVASDGISVIVTTTLPAGNWQVDERHVLPDITYTQNRALVSNWWWEIARRVYYAQNTNYQCQVTLGIFTATSLGDIVGVTRQNNTLGPHWSQKPFYVQQIDYALDMTSRTWTTTISTIEVTSALLTPIVSPPNVVPRT